MGEAEEDGGDEQADPQGFGCGGGDVEEIAAVEELLAQAGGKGEGNGDEAFGVRGGNEFADVFDLLGVLFGSDFALLVLVEKDDRDDEDDDADAGEDVAGIDAEILAELREREAVAVEERDGEQGEGPDRENVPQVDVEHGLEAGIDESVGEWENDDEDESEEEAGGLVE
jgi:hypothetical protein